MSDRYDGGDATQIGIIMMAALLALMAGLIGCGPAEPNAPVGAPGARPDLPGYTAPGNTLHVFGL